MSRIYLSLGTNLGDRHANLQSAIGLLGAETEVASGIGITHDIKITAVSPVYQTAPWGLTDQPDFLNLCVAADTDLSPDDLLTRFKTIETELGRVASHRWGPRLIDIDILFYDDLVMQDEELTIPHASIANRAFVLAPLADIAADFLHPQTRVSVQTMLDAIDKTAVTKLFHPFPTNKTYIMGIINATPDSFSGDGLGGNIAAAVSQALQFVADGADILDIGAESTRPGSAPISPEEEMARLIPVITAVRAVVDLPISVDTYRASVAEAALQAGADWVNDVWGLRMDTDIAGLIARAGCPIVLMHNRSKPKEVAQEATLGGRYVGAEYDDLLVDVQRELEESVAIALAAGVKKEQIILDPGIGFGKTVEQNLQLLNQLPQIKAMGFPILLGTSRKSFIGYTLDLPPDERVEGTAATVAIGIERGADIIRVHDVKVMARVARMTDAIVKNL